MSMHSGDEDAECPNHTQTTSELHISALFCGYFLVNMSNYNKNARYWVGVQVYGYSRIIKK